ncbi:15.4 kDa class V heat shock protein [Acorus calamus]|uniref:15.4 kDa class V heat shock protein n=1 Tax=Acorus calamus TaxID=4465 RepID=A0AAV9DV72_ACOCL|nr:15.4 kDa class V heat shock protein [Acorus calamus]
MDLYPIQPPPWPFFLPHPFFINPNIQTIPQNHVNWSETPEFHIYTADLPGAKKEEIKVEVEDSRYIIIRTEPEETPERAESGPRRFKRKFRLPERVDVEGITASYEDGVLTVSVPRLFVGPRRFRIDPSDLPEHRDLPARAA